MLKQTFFLGIVLCISALAGTAHSLLTFGSCITPPVISDFSAINYAGKWYEYQRYTPIYEFGTSCVTATYGYLNSSTISVYNVGVYLSLNNRTTVANGTGVVADSNKPNQLTVRFPRSIFGIDISSNGGSYNVLQTDYTSYSLVYSCSTIIPRILRDDTVWILSRTKTLSQDKVTSLHNYLTSLGFDVSKFDTPQQVCDN